ncbi:hypothetical protein HN358_01105 [Candidatus Uhrbacteria bacterium]|jgi:hypothetical protein|nr:hypothetical protein [Candidatus Uhrbacteria bacterium]MBT7717370.1 hypothetical protein [Candidatus Uhrbacteria bacterium]
MAKQQPKGIALLLTVIVVGVTGFAVMAFIARSGIASLRSSQYQKESIILENQLSGCVDEVIAQHLIDTDFNRIYISLGPSTCTIATIASSPTQKTLELSTTNGISTHTKEITIGLDPVSLISIN